jgi:hypothetical protein
MYVAVIRVGSSYKNKNRSWQKDRTVEHVLESGHFSHKQFTAYFDTAMTLAVYFYFIMFSILV